MKAFSRFSGVLLLLYSFTAFAQKDISVPLEDPLYDFLQMLPVPALYCNVNTAQKPYTRGEVHAILSGCLRDGIIDSATVRYWTPLPESSAGSAKNRSFLASNDNAAISAFPVVDLNVGLQNGPRPRIGYTENPSDSSSTGTGFDLKTDVGGIVDLSIRSVSMHFDGWILTQFNSQAQWMKVNDPHQGVNHTTILSPTGEPGNFMGTDKFRSYIYFPNRFADIRLGNDDVAWGYSRDGGLLLSRNQKPFFNVQLSKQIHPVTYQFVFGKLLADNYSQRRYLYAKRYSLQLAKWVTLGMNDQVISINRDFEWIYAIPLLPSYFSEHYLGDPDNRLMSFDAHVLIANRVRLYGELVLDDISNLLGVFKNDNAFDKWGAIVGVSCFLPTKRCASSIGFEFTTIEPWMYTTSARNNDSLFNYPVHFGQPLGAKSGPHSRDIKITHCASISPVSISTYAALGGYFKGSGPGSGIYEQNTFVIEDTLPSGELTVGHLYEDKPYRFKDFSAIDYYLDLLVRWNPRKPISLEVGVKANVSGLDGKGSVAGVIGVKVNH